MTTLSLRPRPGRHARPGRRPVLLTARVDRFPWQVAAVWSVALVGTFVLFVAAASGVWSS